MRNLVIVGGITHPFAAAGAELAAALMSHVVLRDSDLAGAQLAMCDLSHADLRGVRLVKADMRGANLSRATLTGAEVLQNFNATRGRYGI